MVASCEPPQAAPDKDGRDSVSSNWDWSASAKIQFEHTQPVADLIANLVKIGAGLSSIPTALGALLLISYLHQAGAPLPPFDASTGFLFLLVAAVFIVALAMLSTFLLWPFFLKARDSEVVRTAFSDLYGEDPLTHARAAFIRSYMIFFSPFLSFTVAAFSLIMLGKWVHISTTIHFVVILVFAFVVGSLVIGVYLRKRITSVAKKMGLLLTVLGSSMQSSLWALLWTLTLSLVIIPLGIRSRLWPNPNVLLDYLACGLALLLFIGLHFCLYTRRVRQSAIAMLSLVLFIISAEIYPGMPYLGGLVLQYLGVGGALPVSLTLKASSEGTVPITGCLIVALNGQVSIRTGVSQKDCDLKPAFGFEKSLPENTNVETYQRSDVVKLSTIPR